MEKPKVNYKSIAEIGALYTAVGDTTSVSAYDRIKYKLVESGFGKHLLIVDSYLKDNPEFLEVCNKIQAGIDEHNAILLLVDDMKLIWDIHKFFPILYAINNLGKSVFRMNIKHLINALINRDKDDAEFEKKFYQNLVLFSNLFFGDNRISSLSPSIEGLITPLMFSKKVVFTSHTVKTDLKSARKDALYKLNTFYSPSFEQTFTLHVAPIFIQTFRSKASLWED